MLKIGSVVKVADNSGAKSVRIIGTKGFSKKRSINIGNIVVVSVVEATPRAGVKTHEVVKAVVARTRKEQRRKDGSYIRFDDNAVVLLEGGDLGKKSPRGTRIFGPIARELKDAGYEKIISLAPEVL